VSSRLVGSGAMGADLDASNRAASRPELGLAVLTPRLFSFWSRHDVRVASSGRTDGRTGGGTRERRQRGLLLSPFVRRRRLPDFGEHRRSADAAAAVVVCLCYRWAWARRGCVPLKESMTWNKLIPFRTIENQFTCYLSESNVGVVGVLIHVWNCITVHVTSGKSAHWCTVCPPAYSTTPPS